MKQVNLGSQSLRVPAIGLGCMGMSEFYGSSSEAQNLCVLDRAADIGCTFWDTSDMYGPFTNEILLSYVGLSEADPETIARAHEVHPVSALQTEYSLWSRDVEADILPTIQRLNIGFVAYSPLGRGFLSGAIRSRSDLEPGDWRLENPRFTEEAIARNSRLADLVAEVAEEIEATAAQVALAWVLSRNVPR